MGSEIGGRAKLQGLRSEVEGATRSTAHVSFPPNMGLQSKE